MKLWRPQTFAGEELWTHDIIVYDKLDVPDDQAKVPLRVQLNSHELRDELSRIFDLKLTSCPTVFVDPFRVLLVRRDALAAAVEAMQADLRGDIRNNESELSDDTSARDETQNGVTQTPQLVESMQELLDFVDNNLGHWQEHRAKLQSRKPDFVAHDDLWHLFKPGDYVFKKPKKTGPREPTLYRVHCVSGGREILRGRRLDAVSQQSFRVQLSDRTNTADNTDNPSNLLSNSGPNNTYQVSFGLSCHNFTFDGTVLGPQEVVFAITGYFGTKAVRDLDVYPAEYHPDWATIRSKLTLRGKKYQELIKTPSAHKFHNARALKPEQDVQGEIIIDFEQLRREQDITIQTVLEAQVSPDDGTFEEYICPVPGCDKCTRNFDDSRLDAQLTKEWLASHNLELLPKDPTEDDLPDHLLDLLDNVLGGYSLRDRQWCTYYLDSERMTAADVINLQFVSMLAT
jgi:hypothetical protein